MLQAAQAAEMLTMPVTPLQHTLVNEAGLKGLLIVACFFPEIVGTIVTILKQGNANYACKSGGPACPSPLALPNRLDITALSSFPIYISVRRGVSLNRY